MNAIPESSQATIRDKERRRWQEAGRSGTVRVATGLGVLVALYAFSGIAPRLAPASCTGTELFVPRIVIGLVILGSLSLSIINPLAQRQILKAGVSNHSPEPTAKPAAH